MSWEIDCEVEAILKIAQCGLTLEQILVILFIKKGYTRTIDLAKIMEVSPPTVSGLIDRLVQKGLVVRDKSALDRRVYYLRVLSGADEVLEDLATVFR